MNKKFYLIGAGDYGKQLKVFLKKNKIVSLVQFVDDKLDLNVNNFFKKKNKVYFNITISKPLIRELIYLKLTKKNFFYKTLIFPNKNMKQVNKNNNFIKDKTKLKFQVYFPNSLKNRSKVDEILIFI